MTIFSYGISMIVLGLLPANLRAKQTYVQMISKDRFLMPYINEGGA